MTSYLVTKRNTSITPLIQCDHADRLTSPTQSTPTYIHFSSSRRCPSPHYPNSIGTSPRRIRPLYTSCAALGGRIVMAYPAIVPSDITRAGDAKMTLGHVTGIYPTIGTAGRSPLWEIARSSLAYNMYFPLSSADSPSSDFFFSRFFFNVIGARKLNTRVILALSRARESGRNYSRGGEKSAKWRGGGTIELN